MTAIEALKREQIMRVKENHGVTLTLEGISIEAAASKWSDCVDYHYKYTLNNEIRDFVLTLPNDYVQECIRYHSSCGLIQ